MNNLVDSYLLFRVRTKRDPEAFARIYDRYVEAIYRYAYLKLPNREDAQDIAAETFTRTWQYANSQVEIGQVRAFLYRVARNLIADHYRRRKETVSLDAVTFEGDSASSVIESQHDLKQGQAQMETGGEASLVLRKLERLKEDYRDVLTLRLVNDLPFSTIGEILEKPQGTVRVIYHRALKALQELDQTA